MARALSGRPSDSAYFDFILFLVPVFTDRAFAVLVSGKCSVISVLRVFCVVCVGLLVGLTVVISFFLLVT